MAVERRQLLVEGLELLLGGDQLLVGRLVFLIEGQRLLVDDLLVLAGRLEFSDRAAKLGPDVLELSLELGDARGVVLVHLRARRRARSGRVDEGDEEKLAGVVGAPHIDLEGRRDAFAARRATGNGDARLLAPGAQDRRP